MDPMTGDGDIDTVEEHLTEVARALFAAGTVQGSLQKAVDLAVATVDGCDAAGVAVDRGGTMVPVAYSKDLAARLYELQSVTAEGPSLEALRHASNAG